MEKIFFFQYHLHQDRNTTLAMPIYEREWMIARFIQQKDKEHDAMEKASKRKK